MVYNVMDEEEITSSEMTDASDDFENVYRENQPLIYRFMFWRTKDQMLAQDLASNVFEKAWRTRRSFTGGSRKAWLFRIAHTTLIDHWRKPKDVVCDDQLIERAESTVTPAGDVFDQQLLAEKLQAAIAALPEGMRKVVELRFIENMSARQVGDRLGLSESNVRIIQYRALQKLRKHLQ